MSAKAGLSSASWHWHSTSSAGLRPGQIGSPTPRSGPERPADEVAPRRDDAGRVVADVAHVDELDALGGGAEALAQRPQLRRLERDHHRLAGGDALLDERGDTVQERLGAGIEHGFVAEHESPALTLLRRYDKLPQCGGSGWPCSCWRRAWPPRPPVPPIPAAGSVTGTTTLPLLYYQGVTVDPARNFYFDGIFVGLYRTTPASPRPARTADVIPPDVHASEGYNHIGDISLDRAEGGRVLLPLECYVPNGPNGGNPCLHGSIGVADPGTLQWRYYVKLDPAEIPKAMWNEVSPDGTLVWTSSGGDLLAYRAADISLANAAPAHAPIHSVRRLKGAVPPTGITGATFVDGRMLVAGQDGKTFRVYSIDLATGARELEIERTIVGESEGLVTAAAKGGTLGWLIQPFNPEGNPPTYSPDHATLVSFARGPGAVGQAGPRRARRRPAPAPGCRPRSASSTARAGPCCGAASWPACCARRAAGRR